MASFGEVVSNTLWSQVNVQKVFPSRSLNIFYTGHTSPNPRQAGGAFPPSPELVVSMKEATATTPLAAPDVNTTQLINAVNALVRHNDQMP